MGKSEKARSGECADGIGRRIVNGNDGHRLSQRHRPHDNDNDNDDGDDARRRLIAAINIKPTSRDRLFTLCRSCCGSTDLSRGKFIKFPYSKFNIYIISSAESQK